MSSIRRALPLALLCLTACTQFPELDSRADTLDPRAPYPALVPVEPLLAQAGPARIDDGDQAALAARIAGLRARASRLRATVLDSDTRSRMQQGVSR